MLELEQFRCFETIRLTPQPEGITVLTGPNGSGKTSLLEAVGYLAGLGSFRGAPREALVREGAQRGFVRGSLVSDGRQLLIEAEVVRSGRARIQLNRQVLGSRRALAEVVAVSVFSPEDLDLLQGSPAGRRRLLDEGAAAVVPAVVPAQERYERAVRQRNAVLRQSGGRAGADVIRTLDVWDGRLEGAGTAVRGARESLIGELQPLVQAAYRLLLGPGATGVAIGLTYVGSWSGSLGEALGVARETDLRRGSTSVGPHHDELEIRLAGRDARQQASQGEQRCLALALRLAVHQLVTTRRGVAPLLLLDDVFSELDPIRSRALVDAIPRGQTLLTTATPLPADLPVAATVPVCRSEVGPAQSGGAS